MFTHFNLYNSKVKFLAIIGVVGMMMALVGFSTRTASAQSVTELQAMINQLMAQISVMQSGGQGTPATGVKNVDVNSFVRTSSAGSEEIEAGLEDVAVVNISVPAVNFDRYANTVVLEFTPASDNEEMLPWVAFDEVSLWSRSWKVLKVDAGNASLWKKVGKSYQITVFKGNHKIAANRAYNLEAAVTTDKDSAIAGDRWTVTAPKKGVVIWSKANGHMTNAAKLPSYPIEFVKSDGEQEIDVQQTSDKASLLNPSTGVFEIKFDVTAGEEGLYIEESAYNFETKQLKPGINYSIIGPNGQIISTDGPDKKEGVRVSSTVTSSADEVRPNVYEIDGGETESFTLKVVLSTNLQGEYSLMINGLTYTFNPSGTNDLVWYAIKSEIMQTMSLDLKASGQGTSPVMSPDGSTISITSGGMLQTEHGIWTFGATKGGGGSIILLNGKQAAKGSAVALHVKNGAVFAHNSSNVWYEWQNNSRWVKLGSNPLVSSAATTINLSVNSSSIVSSRDRLEISYSVDPVPAQGTIRAYIKNMADGSDYPIVSTFLLSQEVNKKIDLAQQPPATMPKSATWAFNPGLAPSLLPVKGPLVVEVTGANGYVVRKEIPLTITKTPTLVPTLTLTSPTTNQSYKIGDTINIVWRNENLSGDIANITLLGNNTERHIIKSVPIRNGKATYTIPASDSLGAMVEGNYDLSIWVTNIKDGDPKNVKSSVKLKIVKSDTSTTPTTTATSSLPLRFVTVTGANTATIKTTFEYSNPSPRSTAGGTGSTRVGTLNMGDGVTYNLPPLAAGERKNLEQTHTYTKSGRYTMTITDQTGRTVSRVVDVVVPGTTSPVVKSTTTAPVITRFVSSPASILSGNTAVLSWAVKDAQRCILQSGLTEEVVAVAGTGATKIVSPTETTAYRLWCANDSGTGKDGPAVEKTISVKVNPVSALPISPDGSTISITSGGALRNSSGEWKFASTKRGGGQAIMLNNVSGSGSGVELHVLQGGKMFTRNAANNWYEWRNNAWVKLSASPLAPAVVTPPPVPTPEPVPEPVPVPESSAGGDGGGDSGGGDGGSAAATPASRVLGASTSVNAQMAAILNGISELIKKMQ